MKKHMMMALFLMNSANAMEKLNKQPNKELTVTLSSDTWNSALYTNVYYPEAFACDELLKKHNFEQPTVLNWENEYNFTSQCLKKTSCLYQDKKTLQEYDCITATPLSNKPNILKSTLFKMRKYLKKSGEICTLIHFIKEDQKTFLQEINQYTFDALPEEEKKYSARIIKWDKLLADEESINSIIADAGYEIISRHTINYNIIINDQKDFESRIKDQVLSYTPNINLPQETKKELANKYTMLLLEKIVIKNNNNELIYPFSSTEIHLRKLDDSHIFPEETYTDGE